MWASHNKIDSFQQTPFEKIRLVAKTSYIWPNNFYMQTKDEISNKKGFGPHNLMFDLKNMEMT